MAYSIQEHGGIFAEKIVNELLEGKGIFDCYPRKDTATEIQELKSELTKHKNAYAKAIVLLENTEKLLMELQSKK